MFVIINNIGIKISVDVGVKNSLIKEYVIKDLFVTLVIVNVNVINYVMPQKCLDYKICKSRKRLIDKLVEECSENIDGNKIFYNDYENFGTVSLYYLHHWYHWHQ